MKIGKDINAGDIIVNSSSDDLATGYGYVQMRNVNVVDVQEQSLDSQAAFPFLVLIPGSA